jgi:hypothetical protein
MSRLPLILQGLAAEAHKAGSWEGFRKDFLLQIKHGLYWHWTDDPNFQIDLTKGPRDLSSMANPNLIGVGKLMITSDLKYWSDYGGDKGRPYVAIIDMSSVPRNAYQQVNRGFGNEFMVFKPEMVKVIKVVPRKRAFQINREQHDKLPHNEQELYDFYLAVTKFRFGLAL